MKKACHKKVSHHKKSAHHTKSAHHKKMKEAHRIGHYESADPMMGHSESMPHKEKKHNFISGAIKHPGALRKELHVKKGHKIPEKKLEKAAHHKGKEGQRARLALTLKRLRPNK